MVRPAFVALIIAVTMTEGGTFLQRINTSWISEIRTPERRAENQRPTGIKYSIIQSPNNDAMPMATIATNCDSIV
jgi:hypothetical protein